MLRGLCLVISNFKQGAARRSNKQHSHFLKFLCGRLSSSSSHMIAWAGMARFTKDAPQLSNPDASKLGPCQALWGEP